MTQDKTLKIRFTADESSLSESGSHKKLRPVLRLLKALLWIGAGLFVIAVAAFMALYLYLTSDVPTTADIRRDCLAISDDTFEGRNHPLPLAEIPPMVQKAFLAAEDFNFYNIDHGHGALKKIVSHYRCVYAQGICERSNIFQQVVKQCMPHDRWRRDARLIKESILAFRIEAGLTNDEVFEFYLNSIFLGRRAYGVEAAAQTYYGKPIKEVTVAEAAQLASLTRSPVAADLTARPEQTEARRLYTLELMFHLGYITEEEAQAAKAEEIIIKTDAP